MPDAHTTLVIVIIDISSTTNYTSSQVNSIIADNNKISKSNIFVRLQQIDDTIKNLDLVRLFSHYIILSDIT